MGDPRNRMLAELLGWTAKELTICFHLYSPHGEQMAGCFSSPDDCWQDCPDFIHDANAREVAHEEVMRRVGKGQPRTYQGRGKVGGVAWVMAMIAVLEALEGEG